MVNVDKIQNGLYGLVGIRQPYETEYAIFDADNLASTSGLFLDDMPYFKASYFIDSALGSEYTPTQVNESLKNIMKASIVDVCNRVFDKADIIDRQILYPKGQNKQNLETTLVNGFLGYRLTLSDLKNIAFKINRLILEFSGAGDVKIMLFNSSQTSPIEETTVTISSNYQVVQTDWVIDNVDEYKGEYYLGFNYDATLTPYKRDYKDSNCMSDIKELCIDKIQMVGHNTELLFDLEDVDSLSENNGINLDITVYEDNTSFILNNKFLFARAIQMSACINIYNRFISSDRSNIKERYSKELIGTIMQYVNGIQGDGLKNKGLQYILGEDIIRIKGEIEKLRDGTNGGFNIFVGTLS